jgi:BTB/POZ domain
MDMRSQLTRPFFQVSINKSKDSFKVFNFLATARSSYYAKVFASGEESSDNFCHVKDVSKETFEQFLRYIYTDETGSLNKNAEELMVLAVRYEMEELKTACEKHLEAELDESNAIEMFRFANCYAFKGQLKVKAFQIMQKVLRRLNQKLDDELINEPQVALELAEMAVKLALKVKESRLKKVVTKIDKVPGEKTVIESSVKDVQDDENAQKLFGNTGSVQEEGENNQDQESKEASIEETNEEAKKVEAPTEDTVEKETSGQIENTESVQEKFEETKEAPIEVTAEQLENLNKALIGDKNLDEEVKDQQQGENAAKNSQQASKVQETNDDTASVQGESEDGNETPADDTESNQESAKDVNSNDSRAAFKKSSPKRGTKKNKKNSKKTAQDVLTSP